MEESRPTPDPEERDERATDPPDEEKSSAGPQENPDVSEEALRNEQQDSG